MLIFQHQILFFIKLRANLYILRELRETPFA